MHLIHIILSFSLLHHIKAAPTETKDSPVNPLVNGVQNLLAPTTTTTPAPTPLDPLKEFFAGFPFNGQSNLLNGMENLLPKDKEMMEKMMVFFGSTNGLLVPATSFMKGMGSLGSLIPGGAKV